MTPFSLPTHIQFKDPIQAKAILTQQVHFAKSVLFLTVEEAHRLQLSELIQGWCDEGLIWIQTIPEKLSVSTIQEIINPLIGLSIEAIVAIGDQNSIILAKVIAWLLPRIQSETDLSELNLILRQAKAETDPKSITTLAIPTDFSPRGALSFRIEVEDDLALIEIEDPALAVTSALIVNDWMDAQSKESILKAGYMGLSQAAEAYWATSTGPFVQSLSIQSIKLIIRSLPVVLANPNQKDAFQALLVGCLQATLAQNNTQVGAIHGLALAISQRTSMNLSIASALTLPDFLKLNLGYLTHPENLYEAFNINNPQELRSWLEKTATGVFPMNLAKVGLIEKALGPLSQQALSYGHPELNPVLLTSELLREFLKLHL